MLCSTWLSCRSCRLRSPTVFMIERLTDRRKLASIKYPPLRSKQKFTHYLLCCHQPSPPSPPRSLLPWLEKSAWRSALNVLDSCTMIYIRVPGTCHWSISTKKTLGSGNDEHYSVARPHQPSAERGGHAPYKASLIRNVG